MKKQVLILGLGRLGISLATTLFNMGHDVMAVDDDEKRIQSMSSQITHAVQADATDEAVLKELGVGNFDVAIVTMGLSIQSSVLSTILLKKLGVPYVIARAENELHGSILEKIGADKVVFPEREIELPERSSKVVLPGKNGAQCGVHVRFRFAQCSEALEQRLGVRAGGTTEDLRFTLETVFRPQVGVVGQPDHPLSVRTQVLPHKPMLAVLQHHPIEPAGLRPREARPDARWRALHQLQLGPPGRGWAHLPNGDGRGGRAPATRVSARARSPPPGSAGHARRTPTRTPETVRGCCRPSPGTSCCSRTTTPCASCAAGSGR